MCKVLLVVIWIAAAAFCQPAETRVTSRFIGSWELVSYALRLPSGAVAKPFGDHPVGRILYQGNGQMSAQLMQPATKPFLSGDPLKATTTESERAWRNYLGYWGKFRVDAKTGIVVHRIEGGWFPNWAGQEQFGRSGLSETGWCWKPTQPPGMQSWSGEESHDTGSANDRHA